MAQLLLEILSEEIPARMQARAAEDLKRLITGRLENDALKFESLQTFVTPRRLTLVVDGLPVETEAVEEVRRGPPKAAPEKAVAGFAKSNGVSVDQLEIRDTGKGEYYFAVVKEDARQTIDHMPLIVSEAVFNMGWPKSMRWNSTAMTWVRPIQSILAIFDGKPIDDVFQLGLKDKIPGLKIAMNYESAAAPGELEIPISNRTQGHRFMAPGEIKVKDFKDYEAKLRKAKVILDAGDRAEIIKAGAERLAAAKGLKLRDDPALLAEVAGLVEWPVPLIGAIDAQFMELPPEVLSESMRAHQKYFALETKGGALAPRFITVANIETKDVGAAIIAGNERVLRARLADARFFWDRDRKASLESRVAKLAEIVFHARLGTVAQKIDRLESLAAGLCEFIPGADRDQARAAARLAKADLTTAMVGEFPGLQGIMGRYYALNDGEHKDVADAIAAHYSPAGPGDTCPTAPTAIAVALADKIDSLVGFFAIDEKPTGSRDPFALRRAALGVIRIIIENGLRVPLREVIKSSYLLQPSEVLKDWEARMQAADIATKQAGLIEDEAKLDTGFEFGHILLPFFADRLKVQMRSGVRHDLIEAVFATPKPEGGAEDDLVRLLARVAALAEFLATDDGANLLVAYKRAANIVRIEEKNDGKEYTEEVQPNLFDSAFDIEDALWQKLISVQDSLNKLLREENFFEAMETLAQLRKPIDAFFENVTVNVKNNDAVRANRLGILRSIAVVMKKVADFSRIEG